MKLLSIQSHVAYGHVGNSAAVFPLQRLGIEVWPVHTIQFSNHTGYESWRGDVFAAEAVRAVVTGIAERGVFAQCDGVLSGYMGAVETGDVILDAVRRVKAANPRARYCFDPVIGDVGTGVFVRDGIPQFMTEHVLPAADLITPNQFELEYLAKMKTGTVKSAFVAIERLHVLGPKTVLVTSVQTDETPADCLDLLASDGHERWRLRTPKLRMAAVGAGDVIAALFMAHYLKSGSVAHALSRAGSSIFGILRRTAEAGAGEMVLIEAQEEIVHPTRIFEPERIQP